MSTLIIQFAKYPELGNVKTRLEPYLGQQKCLALHEALVKHTSVQILKTDFDSALFVSKNGKHPLVDELSEQMPLYIQEGQDLGERMLNAFKWGLGSYEKVILVGSDCPVLTQSHYEQIDSGLNAHDCAFIPAEDGGYVLVAMSTLCPDVFSNIRWGTEQVWQQTQSQLANKSVFVLEPLWDVDREADFIRLKQTIPALCAL